MTPRREPFDSWLHNYKPLSGRRRVVYRLKRIIGAIIGLFFALVCMAFIGVGGLIVAGVLIVLFAGLL